MSEPALSVVIPVHNECENVASPYADLLQILKQTVRRKYEIIYVDDGSLDATAERIAALCGKDKRVKLLSLSRNFGKEIALAAGIAAAAGKAILTLDGDGQHPVERIPDFVSAWQDGAQVVVGIRQQNQSEGWIKKYGSKLFYALFNRLSGTAMIPGSTDFRLIDREVQQQFIKLHEPQSVARGLIDWLGFQRAYIPFTAHPRRHGEVAYKFHKLVRLAAHSFVSLSPTPLYVFGYMGLAITSVSFVLGAAVFVEQILLGDPWTWDFTGTAMLSILVLFLVGLTLISQGVLALYISYIYTQSKGRPLYVINHQSSIGIKE